MVSRRNTANGVAAKSLTRRKFATVALAAAITIGGLAACDKHGTASNPVPYTEGKPKTSSSAPAVVATSSPAVVDPATAHFSDVNLKVAEPYRGYQTPDSYASVHIKMEITNKGTEQATYTLTFGVFDSTWKRIDKVLVDLSDQPVDPGQTLKVDDSYVLYSTPLVKDKVLKDGCTLKIEAVDYEVIGD